MNGKYFYFAVAAVFGVLTSMFYCIPFLLLTIIYLGLLYKYKKFTKPQIIIVITIFSAFFLSGFYAVTHNKSILPESMTTFYLEYTENAKINGDLLQVTARDVKNNETLLIRYKIKSEAEKEALKETNFYGRICQATGKLSDPSIAKNPNAFNYRKYLASKQIYKIFELNGHPLSCAAVKSTPVTLVKELRFNGILYLEKHFPAEIAALSAALIFGDRSMFDPEVLIDYQKTGIVHLLAISGLHVSLLIGMVFFLGIRIGLTRQFMMNFLLVILPIYAMLTGASPSVIRSVLMLFLVLLVLRRKKKIKLSPIDAISLTLMIYVFFTPLVILDAGFQLSFSVSFAIILSSSRILPRYQQSISAMIVISIISQLAALPILLYHFFEISFISILANLLYIPLFSFVFLPGLYLLFFIQIIFGDTPSIFIDLFLKIINLANGLIGYLADLSFAQFVTGRPNLINFIIYILIILIIFILWEADLQQKRKQTVLLLSIVLFTFQNAWNWVNPYGEITMIDVGQGDSILIHYPFGKGTYLIDTGGTIQFEEEDWKKSAKEFEVGRDVVVPFLKGKGITKIDKLILTHGDTDHIGGTHAILKELKVKQIIMPSVAEPSTLEIQILQEANKKGIPVVKVAEGSQWTNGVSLFYVLSPEKNFQGERNSGSIAILATVGGLNWFFGGDLDQEGEVKIMEKYPNLKIDVLKAGHHGSKTSSSEVFINSIKPTFAWISVGERNRYGHPHSEVLERLSHTKIFRTDHDGAITYRFYQESGTFSSFLHMIKQ
jgi:competence protein ComEC